MTLTLESLLTSRAGIGLETATPVQRAVCRVSDGRDIGGLWADQAVRRSFGGVKPAPGIVPLELCILAGIRGGKSLISAAKSIQISQTCDVNSPQVRPGHYPRIALVSTSKDNAKIVFDHLVGSLEHAPALRSLMMGAPRESEWIKSVTLRHPSGVPVEVRIVVLSRAGASLVGRPMGGVVFDEAPRMVGAEEGVMNLTDARRAVLGRILPGGQILYIGSPWAPFGPIYEMHEEHFGRPSQDVVVVRARGPDMNPYYWTPEACSKLRRRDPIAHQTDVEARFADPEQTMFPSVDIERATRQAPLELQPQERWHYVAAMDPATRGNAWTLVIIGCSGFGMTGRPQYTVAVARQRVGSSVTPLSPREVMHGYCQLAKVYGCDTIISDQYAADALKDFASDDGIMLQELQLLGARAAGGTRFELFDSLRVYLTEGQLELPNVPELRGDLVMIKRRITPNGVTVVLPRSAGGRHCDFGPPLAMAMANPPEPPDQPAKPADHDFDWGAGQVTPENYWDSTVGRITGNA